MERWNTVTSSIFIYNTIWLSLQFSEYSSKDSQTISYLDIVLVSCNGTTLENNAKL